MNNEDIKRTLEEHEKRLGYLTAIIQHMCGDSAIEKALFLKLSSEKDERIEELSKFV